MRSYNIVTGSPGCPVRSIIVISLFDMFKVGIGPSSSHTVGPMKAGKQFVDDLVEKGLLDNVTRVAVDVYGSLSLTGKGHHTDIAIIMGLKSTSRKMTECVFTTAICRCMKTGCRSTPGMTTRSFIARRTIPSAAALSLMKRISARKRRMRLLYLIRLNRRKKCWSIATAPAFHSPAW
ncbi:L-serine deaminase 1 [Salmonella enterica subsp. enterica serovar Montevideo str. S5-403]|uniref:L-serine ammonia-lyase n=1 Tax=Salmonella enterica subsp. enterica serovar Montevideo str. S5-403 TaxID=913242 RepID=G5Q1U2_SALMO|nr:L-serine deaminase 1 [Salmonella enterica subsp. enterica serovar Montevideo str. S5-403]